MKDPEQLLAINMCDNFRGIDSLSREPTLLKLVLLLFLKGSTLTH